MTSKICIYEEARDGDLAQLLSSDRFSRYLLWADQDTLKAFELYALNTALSESLYTPLQMLEITLRNRIHAVMAEAHSEYWFDDPRLVHNNRQQSDIRKAKEELERSKKREYTASDVLASLTFGFWGTLLNHRYETLWRSTLHRIAEMEGKRLKRASIADPVSRIRKLRNRIAHHEPIIHWNLPKYHQEILQLTGWLSPIAATWSQHHSRYEQVYPKERIILK